MQSGKSFLEHHNADTAAARQSRDALKREVQSGLGSAQDASDLATAEAELATAEAARDDFLAGVFEAATDSLGAGVEATLQTIADNRQWGLPLQYLVVDRTDAEWITLRDALANIKISAKIGDDPDSACEDLVGDEDADADVSAAATSLSSNASSVASSWATAVAN